MIYIFFFVNFTLLVSSLLLSILLLNYEEAMMINKSQWWIWPITIWAFKHKIVSPWCWQVTDSYAFVWSIKALWSLSMLGFPILIGWWRGSLDGLHGNHCSHVYLLGWDLGKKREDLWSVLVIDKRWIWASYILFCKGSFDYIYYLNV